MDCVAHYHRTDDVVDLLEMLTVRLAMLVSLVGWWMVKRP